MKRKNINRKDRNITTTEAAKKFNIYPNALRIYAKGGTLPSVKRGNRYLIREAKLNKFYVELFGVGL